ncbi:hypothetical protein SAMN05421734_10353 [Pelagirhabdus alkalitolerans]|uniref:Amidohydrolase 3 domain-containing protein n=1 Tax=Pelagirhabdus alkalitolerans TaxID=1612202 RepID=A0A1G6HJF7_9BACI|nr:amidohydrolase [Pelagirhabdus alkalitolerans]SDB94334.1 hypothetical protein SAMN05421734_10353 [Pelagirhabdus alkalitolerans]
MGTLWYNGVFYTMRDENETTEAIFTESGVVVDIGNYKSLKDRYGKRVKTEMNMNGDTVFPGFVDSHLHIIGQGEKLDHLDLSDCTSREEVLRRIKLKVDELKPGQWLFGEGWNDNQWEDQRVIDRDELDQLTAEHPIILTRICRHAIVANSKAISMSGIDAQTKDPQGGKIVRDHKKRMTGYFLDSAQDMIKQAVPDRTVSELKQLIRYAVDHMLSLGLVGGHSEDLAYYGKNSFQNVSQAYAETLNEHNRLFRAHLLVHHDVVDDYLAAFDQKTIVASEYVEYGAMKIFSDGALGGRTAWLYQPYSDDSGNTGLNMHTHEDLKQLIMKARKHNLPVAVHTIGDRAIETVIDLLKQYPLATGGRDRLIHAVLVNESIVQKLKSIDVTLDIQPTFVSSDFPWVIDRLGEDRVNNAYVWKRFLEEGIACAAGSDAPIETVNPLSGIQAFVERRSTIDGVAYTKDERINVFQAISLYTNGSAYAIGKEKERGYILPGYTADFTVLNNNPFDVEPSEIEQIPVNQTIINERIVFSR